MHCALGRADKEINAPVGQLALDSIKVSTKAIESNDPGDTTYTNLENQLTSITTQRDALATQMIAMLQGAEFNNQSIDATQAQSLIDQGNALLQQVNTLAVS